MEHIRAEGTSIGTITGEGPFGSLGSSLGSGGEGGTTALQKVTGAVSAIIGFLTIVAAIWFLFQFLLGGFSWITAGGDKTKLNEARDKITNAFVGLIIVIAGWGILALAGQFFGWDMTLSDPGSIIDKIKFQ